MEEGRKLSRTVLEYSYKNDDLGDPLINDLHALALDLVTEEELKEISTMTFKINDVLKAFFDSIGITLVDFKVEFGRCPALGNKIILADEISPDTCRFWDKATGEKLDKDRFRRDLGNVEGAYAEIFGRIGLK